MRIYPSDSAPATSRQQERRKRPSSHCCCCPSLPGPSRTQATYISTGTCCSQVRPLFSDSRDLGPTLSPTISALRPRHELGALARRSSPTSLKPIHFLSFALPLRHTSVHSWPHVPCSSCLHLSHLQFGQHRKPHPQQHPSQARRTLLSVNISFSPILESPIASPSASVPLVPAVGPIVDSLVAVS